MRALPFRNDFPLLPALEVMHKVRFCNFTQGPGGREKAAQHHHMKLTNVTTALETQRGDVSPSNEKC